MIVGPFDGAFPQTSSAETGQSRGPAGGDFSGQVGEQDDPGSILERVMRDLGMRIGRTPGDLRPLEELFQAPPRDRNPGPGIPEARRAEPTTRKLVLWAPEIDLPAGEIDEGSDEDVKGAITGTFVEYMNDEREARITPVIHAVAKDTGAVLETVLKIPEGIHDELPQPDTLTPPEAAPEVVPEEVADPFEDILSETAQEIPVTGESSEWQSLYFAPMRAFATGHLDMRVTSGGARLGTAAAAGRATVPQPAIALRASRPQAALNAIDQAGTRAPAEQAAASSSTPAARQAADSARTAAPRSAFYQTIQAVLPPRQNFLLLETGREKRLFVRDYFSPGDTLRHLKGLAQVAPFDLNDLNIIINGKEHGRLGQ